MIEVIYYSAISCLIMFQTVVQRLVLVWVLDYAVFHLVKDAPGSTSTPFLLDLWPTWTVDSGEETESTYIERTFMLMF